MLNIRNLLGLKPVISNYGFAPVRTFKNEFKIKWIRPTRISSIDPQKSGDLESTDSKNETDLAWSYECEELSTANDMVKQLYTLEFLPRKKTSELYIRKMVGRTQRHKQDACSIESKLARWTGAIQSLQQEALKQPGNRRLKVNVKELIEKRKKHLKYLRRQDYKKFEWILSSLNIIFKPPPTEFHWVTRKESLIKLTNKYCDQIRHQRLHMYHLQLLQKQPDFLKEKLRTLEFLQEEQESCGVNGSIGEAEISEIKQKLNRLGLGHEIHANLK